MKIKLEDYFILFKIGLVKEIISIVNKSYGSEGMSRRELNRYYVMIYHIVNDYIDMSHKSFSSIYGRNEIVHPYLRHLSSIEKLKKDYIIGLANKDIKKIVSKYTAKLRVYC